MALTVLGARMAFADDGGGRTADSRPGWSSRSAFVMAAIGSAVGLGNLWRFPAEAGANGGGAFVIFYLLCVILIGMPLLLCETLIGRHGGSSAVESARRVARDSGASPHWSLLASTGVLAAFLILSFYSVVAGWVLNYVGVFAADLISSLGGGTLMAGAFAGQEKAQIEALLPEMFASPGLLVGLHALFMGITLYFVMRGVTKGIEFVAVSLMPAFFVLLLGITFYNLFNGAFAEAFNFLFAFEPERVLHGNVMLSALGQAFFSLSLGSAMMITYGAYADGKMNLAGASAIIAGADSAVAIIAGLAIFPIVFAAGLDAAAGPTLMFQTLPAAFQSMPLGSLIGFAFFVMVFFAALTSSVALLEAPTLWAMEKFSLSRRVASVMMASLAFILGVFSALSFNIMGDFRPLGFIPFFAETNFFDTLDGLTSKILMPLSGLLTALFVGWVADRRLTDAENGISGGLHLFWRFLVAWLCPVALTTIFIIGLFPDLLG